VGVIYGILIHKYEVFPYKIIRMTYQRLLPKSYGRWAIGIYEGSTPFNLTPPEDISNPVLTGKDVTDIDARCVADPFMVFEKGRFYMFFEVLNRKTNKGSIGYAESEDGQQWEYKQIIIDENFHLSYPYIFEDILILVET
jgi:hypothetical protein